MGSSKQNIQNTSAQPVLRLAFGISPPGATVSVPNTLTLDRLEYTSAHDCLYPTTSDDDLSRPEDSAATLTKTDALLEKRSGPFSIAHTRGVPLNLRAWLRVDAANPGPVNTGTFHCTVTATRNKVFPFGQPIPPEDQGLVSFTSGEVEVSGRTFAVDLPGNGAMLNKLKWLRGVEFRWKVDLLVFNDDGSPPIHLTYDAGKSVVDIFLTMSQPISNGSYRRVEDRLTLGRMHAAYTFFETLDKEPPGSAKKLNDADAHALCRCLLNAFGKVNLKPNPALVKLDHPSYFEPKAVSRSGPKGGAWHLLKHLATGERGECQAMVRLMRALVYMVGGVQEPKKAAVVVAYANPRDATTANVAIEDNENDARFASPFDPVNRQKSSTEQQAPSDVIEAGGLHPFEGPVDQKANSEVRQASLLSVVAGENDILSATSGFNFYEAALRLEDGGKVRYYAGGMFTPYDAIDPILRLHYALVWVADAPPHPTTGEDRKVIRKLVKQYR